MTDVLFPPLSKENSETDGILATWYVADGSAVAADQLIAEVQVDKVSADVLAPTAGTVRLLVEEEATVKQGSPIAQID